MSFVEVVFGGGRFNYFIDGLLFTLGTTAISTVLGIVIGLIIAIMRLSNNFLEESKFNFLKKFNIFYYFSVAYTDIIRGTPVIIQLMIINNAIFVGNLRFTPKIIIASIAFGINSGAYVAEILRSGIQSLDKGQMEAARALGMPYPLAMRKIILPQAFKSTLPTLVSEFIILLKETSVVSFIGGADLLRAANTVTSKTYNGTYPLIAVALIFLLLTSVFTFFMRKVERRTRLSD